MPFLRQGKAALQQRALVYCREDVSCLRRYASSHIADPALTRGANFWRAYGAKETKLATEGTTHKSTAVGDARTPTLRNAGRLRSD
jgi:hypothetical protein